jgi:hypothetical protein
LLKRLKQRSDATFMGGELKGFCANSKWQKFCPSATVLSVAHDDGRANGMSVKQADNSWEWMCPIVYLDYVNRGQTFHLLCFLLHRHRNGNLRFFLSDSFHTAPFSNKHEFWETQQFVAQFSYLYVIVSAGNVFVTDFGN